MLQVNSTNETNLAELVKLLQTGKQDEIILTVNDEVVAELISPTKKHAKIVLEQ